MNKYEKMKIRQRLSESFFYQPSAKGCLYQRLGVWFLHLGEDVKMLVEAPARVEEQVTFFGKRKKTSI